MTTYLKQIFQSIDRTVLKLLSSVNLYTAEHTDSQLLLPWLMKGDNLSAVPRTRCPLREIKQANFHVLDNILLL